MGVLVIFMMGLALSGCGKRPEPAKTGVSKAGGSQTSNESQCGDFETDQFGAYFHCDGKGFQKRAQGIEIRAPVV